MKILMIGSGSRAVLLDALRGLPDGGAAGIGVTFDGMEIVL